jgi:hypothetical protein
MITGWNVSISLIRFTAAREPEETKDQGLLVGCDREELREFLWFVFINDGRRERRKFDFERVPLAT